MRGKLEGRVSLVTGGSRGIGFAIAKAFCDEGAQVVINGRDKAVGQSAARQLGPNAMFVPGDLAHSSEIAQLVQTVIAHFGRLDILVNNVGGATSFGPVADMEDETWSQCLDLNLTTTFKVSRSALKSMMPARWGRIINISSVEGKQAKPGLAHYCAAKHGLHGFTKVLAKEVGSLGITVNAICPGLVITDLVRLHAANAAQGMGITESEMLDIFVKDAAIGRPVAAEEVAAMAVLLASDLGAGISGATLSVDGGTAAY